MQSTDRGVSTDKSKLTRILSSVENLKALPLKKTKVDISATWRLLWTTEKETLFILKNAGLFGTVAGEVYQVRTF